MSTSRRLGAISMPVAAHLPCGGHYATRWSYHSPTIGNRVLLVDQKSRSTLESLLPLKDIEKSDMTSLDKYLARQQLAAYKKLMETGEPQTIATAEISPRAKVVTYVKRE